MYVQLVRGKDNFNYHQKTNKPIKTMEKKSVKIRYETSKLINQYSYKVSNKKFTNQALILKSKIFDDIKSTLKLFKNINNEM